MIRALATLDKIVKKESHLTFEAEVITFWIIWNWWWIFANVLKI